MEWWKPALGAAIVLFAVWEMFEDLFHPTRSGALSEWIARGLFHLFRRWKSVLPTSGPLSMVLVIFVWALLLAAGFGLIYWASFPASFELRTATQPDGAAERWWWSFYYSMEMLTTLGLGDIQPNPTGLKVLSALHTLLGFSFITASITWIVLVFPALRRVRTLARKANTLAYAEEQTGVPVASAGMHPVLAVVAEDVIRSRVDLIHFPLLFYFYTQERDASLPCALFPLLRIAEQGSTHGDDLVRLTSVALRTALEDLAELLADRLGLKELPPEKVFQVFADLHGP